MAEGGGQGVPLRRSKRHHKLPSALKDFIIDRFGNQDSSASTTSSDSKVAKLRYNRDLINQEINHDCEQAKKLLASNGSRTVLKNIDTRLEQSFSELKKMTKRILDAGSDNDSLEEAFKDANILSKNKLQVANYQDQIGRELEGREEQAQIAKPKRPATIPGDRVESKLPAMLATKVKAHTPHVGFTISPKVAVTRTSTQLKPQPRENPLTLATPDMDMLRDDQSETSTGSAASSKGNMSVRSKEAQIKSEVADLRVKQEKEIYEEERRLREALEKLELQKKENEAARAHLESELWKQETTTSQALPFTPAQTRKRSRQVQSPAGERLEELLTIDNNKTCTAYDSARPVQSTSTSEKDNLRHFFQGMAKPSIPTFSGDREQFQDWWEQFNIFVHQAEVPVHFKMVMLKNSLSGPPAELVKRLGYTDVQYEMAIAKLEQRYGGDTRLIQRHLDALMATSPVADGDLKGLEKLVNRLYDMVAKLKDAGRTQELMGASALYTIVLQKIPDNILVLYQDNLLQRPTSTDGLATLVQWLNKQVAIRLEMAEIKGLSNKSQGTSKQQQVNNKRTASGKNQKSRSHASETTTSQVKKSGQGPSNSNPTPKKGTTPAQVKNNCPLCQETHAVQRCKKWTESSVQERWQQAKESKLCFRCLKVGHQGKDCAFNGKCDIDGCTKTHHRSLHPTSTATEKGDTPKAAASESVNAFGISKGKVIPTKVALRVLPVYLIDNHGQKRQVNAFLDDGSDSSYLRTEIAKALGLEIESNSLKLSMLVEETEVPSGLVSLTVESLDGKTRRVIGVRTLDRLCEGLSAPDWKKAKKQWDHLQGIDFPRVAGLKKVDLLIGSDHPELALSLEERTGEPGDPVARRTPLGWTCVGAIETQSSQVVNAHFAQTYAGSSAMFKESTLDEQFRQLWNMDTVTSNAAEPFSKDEQAALDLASRTIRLKESKRYEIGIPWKGEGPCLPDNREAAVKRLRSLESNLSRKPEVAKRYCQVFQDNIEKGYLQEVSEEDANKAGWYLPHFGVIREDRSTTKVRIVFDAAAKYEGQCVNDKMYPGPKLQLDILDVLVSFRRGEVGLVGDVKEMFSQIELLENDRKYHRMVWRDLDTAAPVRTYEAIRLPFGTRAAPFLAQYVVRNHAEKHKEQFPLAAEVCEKHMYMDDAIKSLDTVEEICTLKDQLTTLLGEAGLTIRKWCSNSSEVLQQIPVDDRATGIFEIEDGELPCIKTLGVKWNANRDVFGFSHAQVSLDAVTKRTLLSLIARLFDPLQLLAPFLIRAKILQQQAWIEGLDWDENFPASMEKQVRAWIIEIPLVEKFEIPRCLKREMPVETSLHTFTDASSIAYGAVVYVRNVYSDESVSVRIVLAKARVSPIRTISIPRLELMAAVLGVRLAVKVSELLDISSTEYWTDSMDVILWLKGQSRKYKPFVSHRVAEIQEKSLPSEWHHVPGTLNPADLATRGATLDFLIEDNLWTEGPEFLLRSKEHWPAQKVNETTILSDKAQTEVTKAQTHAATSSKDEQVFPIQINHFSSWNRLVRVTAWVLRFVKVLKEKRASRKPLSDRSVDKQHYSSASSILEIAEIDAAEKVLVRQIQSEGFGDTLVSLKKDCSLSGNLKPLMPFIDDEGLLRVGGRLQNSDLPYNARHPLLIPAKSHAATLLAQRAHAQHGKHAKGVNAVLADLRQNFWLIHGREEVKRVDRNCLFCAKKKKRCLEQVMAPLPSHRITVPVRAFARVGTDYAGPFIVKITRRVNAKRWLCLFSCTTSRAVHLEVAYSLDTPGFLKAFSRMVARRGKPELVVSDNGTNFVGANRELRELIELMDVDKITEDAVNQGITWRFNPPWGSHHGGLFEAMVKAAKKALKVILGDASVSDEELQTAVVEVEGLLNSRPLTYCSNDPKDETVLTPNHFLMGQSGGQLAPRVVDEIVCNPRHRWRYVQDLVGQVWKRWNKEFLTLLQSRGKWLTEREDIKVDDIVLVADPANPRGTWPLGRVTETLPCQDGHIRSVRVLSRGKEFIRPISKLCKLEVGRNQEFVASSLDSLDHGGEDVETPPGFTAAEAAPT